MSRSSQSWHSGRIPGPHITYGWDIESGGFNESSFDSDFGVQVPIGDRFAVECWGETGDFSCSGMGDGTMVLSDVNLIVGVFGGEVLSCEHKGLSSQFSSSVGGNLGNEDFVIELDVLVGGPIHG